MVLSVAGALTRANFPSLYYFRSSNSCANPWRAEAKLEKPNREAEFDANPGQVTTDRVRTEIVEGAKGKETSGVEKESNEIELEGSYECREESSRHSIRERHDRWSHRRVSKEDLLAWEVGGGRVYRQVFFCWSLSVFRRSLSVFRQSLSVFRQSLSVFRQSLNVFRQSLSFFVNH